MKKNYIILLVLLTISLPGCDLIEQYRHGDAIVTVGGKSLYETDLQQLTAGTANAEDSARIAESYIRQWIIETAMYERARQEVKNGKEIEALVEDYRKTLYVRAYEDKLVREKMLKFIPEDTIKKYYESYSSQFTLQENLIRGLFIVVPLQAPEQEALQSWLGNLTDENLELIEKYAYQNASGYELFTNQWQAQSRILLHMPLARSNMTNLLREQRLISISDSTACYYLRVTDKCMRGDVMPYEYARPEIEKYLLEQRQQEFLTKERDNIYNNIKR